MLRALRNALVSTTLFAACLLAPGRAWQSPRPWTLVGIYLVIHLVGSIRLARVGSALLEERAKPPLQRGQPVADRVLLLGFMASYAAMLVVTGLDAARWHRGSASWAGLAWVGLGLFAAGWTLVLRALETNAFAVTVVRHQAEREHAVVDSGVSAVVRPPMYAGLICVLVGVPLWLRSTLGLAAVLEPIGLLVARIQVEEEVLGRSLPAYAAYAARVRARLLPGVW